jgi:hypothetical protein
MKRPPRIRIPDPKSLTRVESPPPRLSDGWSPPVLPIKGSSIGSVLRDTLYVQRGGRDMLITYDGQEHIDSLIENCAFRCPYYNVYTFWHQRRYAVTGVVRNSRYENVPKEHVIYEYVAGGDMLYSDLLLRNCAANGIQLRLTQQPPSGSPYWNVDHTITFRKIVALECGQKRGAGRAAYVLSPKSPGPRADLVFDGIYIRTVNQRDVDGKGHDSFGGICTELCRNVIGTGGYVEMRKPANPLIQFHDYGRKPGTPQMAPQGSIEWDGLEAYGGVLSLRIEHLNRVRITGGKGDARISLLKARPDGSDWFEWKSIPLTTGYSQG